MKYVKMRRGQKRTICTRNEGNTASELVARLVAMHQTPPPYVRCVRYAKHKGWRGWEESKESPTSPIFMGIKHNPSAPISIYSRFQNVAYGLLPLTQDKYLLHLKWTWMNVPIKKLFLRRFFQDKFIQGNPAKKVRTKNVDKLHYSCISWKLT